MTLYVVMYWRWDEWWELVGIYSTREAAEDAKRSYVGNESDGLVSLVDVRIFQHELDAAGMKHWSLEFNDALPEA